MESFSVAELIANCGTSRLAKAMGLPTTTVHTWKRRDCVPGSGILHDMRVEALKRAAKKIGKKPLAKGDA